jgi:hypothetical protein
MPLSGAERTKLYRVRLREKIGERRLKEDDAARKVKSRKTNIEQSREKERERQQRCREKKRAATCRIDTPVAAPWSPAYKSSSSLGKAIKRAQTGLPQSPRKRQRVVQKLVVKFLPLKLQDVEKLYRHEPFNKLSSDDTKEVVNFYLRSDISWTAPGKKDYVIVKRDGKKQKEQKKILLMSVTEAHQLFIVDHPSIKIGRSKFAQLRPDTVMLAADMPHNLCICKYHANIDLLLEGLNPVTSLPRSYKDLLNKLVCDVQNEGCMLHKCDQCRTKIEDLEEDMAETTTHIKWFQWDKSESGQTVKVAHEGTVHDALEQLTNQLVAFKQHVFIKNKQAAYFNEAYQHPRPGQAIVQIDFSENASIICQDEVQSAHWSHTQVTIYTVVAWTSSGTYSFALTSDYLSHDKYAVDHFNKIIVRQLNARMNGSLKVIDMFSDGAAQHFKQKYSFVSATKLQDDGIQVNWHFFATSHGKGAVDGIGGTVKRVVQAAIKTRRCNVSNALEYSECAKQLLDKTTVIHVLSNEIISRKDELDVLWSNVKSVPGTHDVHCIRSLSVGEIEYSLLSEKVPGQKFQLLAQARNEHAEIAAPVATDIKVGDWVTAIYNDDWYPGVIEAIDNFGILTVKFMEKTERGGKFRWPKKNDVQQLKDSGILCRLPSAPIPSGWSSRLFDVEGWQNIDRLFSTI